MADRELVEAQQLWEHLEEELGRLATGTSMAQQSFDLLHPTACLQAHRDRHQQLQVPHQPGVM